MDRFAAVGLDSGESGNPPQRFARVFAAAREAGLNTVAHAGEEGPPSYIWGALDALGVSRIDHGVRAVEDDALMHHLARRRIPLTVCPLSNVRLRAVPSLSSHPLLEMLARGLCVTINSDDPAYFGGYIGDNYLAVLKVLRPSPAQILQMAVNSVDASFLATAEKAALHRRLTVAAQRTGFSRHLPTPFSSEGYMA